MEDFAINRRYNVVIMDNDTDFLGEYTENVSINDRDLTSPMGI